MNIMKSLSSPNVMKSDPKAASAASAQATSNNTNNQAAAAPSSSGLARVNSKPERTSFDNDKNDRKTTGKVLEKFNPFSGFGSKPAAAPVTKEITGAVSVAMIDQKATVDCEVLFADTEVFLLEAKKTLDAAQAHAANGSTFRKLLNGASLQKWRNKRKGNKLYSQYESLLQRSESCEKELKIHTDKLLNDSSSLYIQALHMKARLTACIEHNKKETERIKPLMDKTKDYLREYVTEKQKVHDMLVFYDEVTNVKMSSRDTYIPWAIKYSDSNNKLLMDAGMLNREFLEKRIKKIEKAIDIFQDLIGFQLPYFQTRKHNLDTCTKSLHTMENILKNINNYRTFIKNTDEATLANTTSRLTTLSDDDHPSEDLKNAISLSPMKGAGADKVVMDNPIRKTQQATKKAGDDEDEEEEEDDDEDEDGLVGLEKTEIDRVKMNSSPVPGPAAPAPPPPPPAAPVPSSPPPATISAKRKPRRGSTLEELVAEANKKSSKPIDESLFANIEVEPYNHSQCSDCSVVPNISNDCSMHLAAIQHQAQESTIRLQKLLELRERVRRRGEVLEGIDWGGAD